MRLARGKTAILRWLHRLNEWAEALVLGVAVLVWDGLVKLALAVDARLPQWAARVIRPPFCYLHGFCNRGDRVLRRCLVASGTAHVVGLMIVTLVHFGPRDMPWRTPPKMVSLVTMPAPPLPASQDTPKPKPAAPKPKKKPPAPKKDTPVLKEKTTKKTEPEKQPEKKPEVKPPPQPETAPADSQQATVANDLLNVTAQVDEHFPFDYYLAIVRRKIAQEWAPPAGTPTGEASPMATMRFRIDRGGMVSGIQVEETSSIVVYDRSAHEALVRAQPLPPLPETYSGRWLTVHLRFRIADSRPTGIR